MLSFLITSSNPLEVSILFSAADVSFRPRITLHGRNFSWMNRIGTAEDVKGHADGAPAIQKDFLRCYRA